MYTWKVIEHINDSFDYVLDHGYTMFKDNAFDLAIESAKKHLAPRWLNRNATVVIRYESANGFTEWSKEIR